MTPPQLWLVRHGETAWSAAGRHTSTTDVALTDRGRQQARDLAVVLSRHEFATVRTSPMRRARETCELAGFGADVSADLCEWDYGDYEGLTTPQIREQVPGWTVWHDPCPGGETGDEVTARADRVVAAARAGSGDTLAFAHAHLLRVVAARWLGLAYAGGALLSLEAASVSVLGWEREQPVISRWNLVAGGPEAR
jgi:broad specificity phosphatase PhoE